MRNKKISRLLSPVLGIIGFMIAIGVVEVPVFADDNVQASSEYTANTITENKDCFINLNKSETQNGIKVTVDKAVATKHKIKVILKVESEKPFDETKYNNSIFEITYGKNNDNYTNSSDKYVDNKTRLITLEKENYEGEYPQKGELRVDVVFSNYKVNIGIDVPVDFTESFNNVVEKDIEGKIPTFNYILNKLESDLMGTRINYSEPKRDWSTEENYDSLYNPVVLLKVGDRIYKTDSNDSYSEEDEVIKGNYEVKSLTYDKVKDEKNISIIPIISDITWEELDKLYNQDRSEEENINKTTTNNNVNYEKNLDFSDGSKGEIYNIERNDNSIKVYCKGESEKESLLMASNIDMYYQYIEGEANNIFYENENVSFYKDPKETLGYIVEFENVEKDKAVDLSFNSIIKYVDRYKLEDEIKILN